MSEDQILILFIVMLCAAAALLFAAVSIKPDSNKIKKGQQTVKEKCKTFNYLRTVSDSAGTEALIKSALAYLDKGNWEAASDYCSKVLEIDPEHTMAYIIKLLAELKLKSIYDIPETGTDISDNVYFRNAFRYADDELRKTLDQLNNRSIYNGGIKKMESAFTAEDYIKAAAIFHSLEKFEDAPQKREYCLDLAAKRRKQEAKLLRKDTKLLAGVVIAVGVVAVAFVIGVYDPFSEITEDISSSNVKKANYERAVKKYENGDYLEAAYAFRNLNGFKDSEEYEKKANDNYYDNAVKLLENGDYKKAFDSFGYLGTYKDSVEYREQAREKLTENETNKQNEQIAAKYQNAMEYLDNEKYNEAYEIFKNLGTYKDSVKYIDDMYNTAMKCLEENDYLNAYRIFEGLDKYKDSNEQRAEIFSLIFSEFNNSNINQNAIAIGKEHIVGLKKDGTVVAKGDHFYGQINVYDWMHIVAVAAGQNHTVGLKANGTVIAKGDNNYGQCDVSEWKDIVAIAAGNEFTVRLKADGTVICTEYFYDYVSDWTEIVAISASYECIVGLRADGTVVYAGNNYFDAYGEIYNWTDIVAVSTERNCIIGSKSDGTVVSAPESYYSNNNISDWTDITAISSSDYITIGLKTDGTVVALGRYPKDVYEWTDIIAVSAGESNAAGLKSDGTVVTAGRNCYDVSGWTDIGVPER